MQYVAPLLEITEQKPTKVLKAANEDSTIAEIKKLLAERSVPQVQSPAPQATYQYPPAGAFPMMQYPVFAAPSPLPTLQIQAPVTIAEPVKVEVAKA